MIEIFRWNQIFENADTRKRMRLKSFHCPSGIESRGLLNLLCHFPTQDALAAFGVFQLICQLSATLPAEHRGRLVHSDGTPMSADFLSRLLRVEICHLSAALEILSNQRVAWILMNESATNLPPICHSSPGFVQGEGEGEGEEVIISQSAGGRIPTVEEVKRYAASAPVPMSEECAIAFHDTQEAAGWITNRGFPIADWRAALRRYASHWKANEQGRNLVGSRSAAGAKNFGAYDKGIKLPD